MNNVVQFPAPPTSTNVACPRCGDEWFKVDAVVLNADSSIDRMVNGYAGQPECASCGWRVPG